jgi:cell division protein ZapA (FtsZ GTPase activity inhibitor)
VSDTSVKIQIANRTYPLKGSAEELILLEKAAGMVNQRLKEYETAFGVRDLQDLLAMCALHMSAEKLGYQKEMSINEEEINRELDVLSDLIKGDTGNNSGKPAFVLVDDVNSTYIN